MLFPVQMTQAGDPDRDNSEIWFYVKNVQQAQIDFARLHVRNVSTIWDRTSTDDSMVVTQLYDLHDLVVPDSGRSLQRFKFGFGGDPWTQLRYGRYSFTIQESDDGSNWSSIDSVIIDYTDSMYARTQYTTMDISVRYDFDTSFVGDEWSFSPYLVEDWEDWDALPAHYFSIWETNHPDPNYVPHTRSFVPERLRDVSVTHNANNRLIVSWLGNGESFDVSYRIYRKTGGGAFVLYDSVSNTGHPLRGYPYSWMDPEVAGSGITTISYYLKARNKSQNSIRVSPSSDTVSTTYGYYLQKQTTRHSPSDFKLFQNFPNPFNPSTSISFEIPEEGMVELKVYNLLGQHVRTLVNEIRSSGLHATIWDGRDKQGRSVGGGIYLYTVATKDALLCRKMILLK